ncbi:DUF2147 domain-containing protein [Pedobacter sp. MW01-1-1]|uniref:DUF2147 domain-containing protein n=1 Tax=Pedobacter sp. MW01-1-1 TaxID=3383027 RepID=UPI003FF03BD9
MKKIQFLVLFLIGLTFQVFAQKQDAVIGQWLNPKGEGKIEITKRGNKYYGKLIWLKEPNENGKPKLDLKNPDESLRSKPLLNQEILKNFVYNDGKWEDGTIYDPKSGKTYSCTLSLKQNNILNIRGFVGISLIGRSEEFTRVK